jgi:hypothetical protein
LARSEFDDFCRVAFRLLDDQGVRYLVIGGLAVIVVGEPRTTGDADVIAFLSVEEGEDLLRAARVVGFKADLRAERASLHETGTMTMRRGRFHLDVLLASLPFEEEAYRRSKKRRMFSHNLRFPTPEDMILFKVLAGEPKDMLDAVGVARRHVKKLDRKYLEVTLRPLCDLAQDMDPWTRLQDVLRQAALGP